MKTLDMIYMATPYSSNCPYNGACLQYAREQRANEIAAKLQHKHNVVIFPPILISAVFKRILPDKFGTSFKAWKDVDLSAISHCDEVWVVMMDGWKESIGVQAEIDYAEKEGIPVKYINPETLRFVKAKVC